MTPLKKTLTAAGLGTAMFAGGVFGAASSNVDGAGAQEAETPAEEVTPTEQDGTEQDRSRDGGARDASKAERRDAMAALLEMSSDELAEALSSGSTIAEVADAQGVDVQVVIDYIVEQGNERIDEAVANGRLTEEEAAEKRAGLIEKAEAAVNGERTGRSGHRSKGGQKGQRSETLADVLGVSVEELREAKQAGTTIAELAEANGVSVDAVVEALVADATARVEGAVESGRISEEEAAEKLAAMEEKIEAIVNGEAETGRTGRDRGNRGSAPTTGVAA